jgi:hypothetical protein
LNRCFVQYEDSAISNGHPERQIILFDAFEQKVYGNYLWINNSGKKFPSFSKPRNC